jgi:hypothetical protein
MDTIQIPFSPFDWEAALEALNSPIELFEVSDFYPLLQEEPDYSGLDLEPTQKRHRCSTISMGDPEFEQLWSEAIGKL